MKSSFGAWGTWKDCSFWLLTIPGVSQLINIGWNIIENCFKTVDHPRCELSQFVTIIGWDIIENGSANIHFATIIELTIPGVSQFLNIIGWKVLKIGSPNSIFHNGPRQTMKYHTIIFLSRDYLIRTELYKTFSSFQNKSRQTNVEFNSSTLLCS